MSREKPAYRDNVEALLRYSGGKHLLTVSDVAAYCGRDRRTVIRKYDLRPGGITVETLARRMSE